MQENRFPEDWQQEEQIKEEKGRSPWTSLIIGLLVIVAILTVFTFFILNKDAALMRLAMNLFLFTVTLPAIAAQAVDTMLLRGYNI